jgi:hypothetical protein
MHTALLALSLLPAAAPAPAGELPSSIRAISERASLHAGVSVQPTERAGEFLVHGPRYSAALGAAGLEFTPHLGRRAPATQTLGLSFQGARRGATSLAAGALPSAYSAAAQALTRSIAPGISESWTASEAGLELSYRFDEKPAGQGDLVVELDLETTFGAPRRASASGLEFALEGVGGLSIGAVTGIDADGDRIAGRLQLIGDRLELSLPESFVESADYPLVLDPLVGNVFTVAGDTIFVSNDDSRPDAAYDASSDQYLLSWQRAISATESRIYARRVSGGGAFTSGVVQLSTASSNRQATNPAVANVNRDNKWVVAWQQREPNLFTPSGAVHEIRYVTLDSNFVVFATPSVVISSGTAPQIDPDVVGEGIENDAGLNADFCVVWHDTANDRIALRHFYWNSLGVFVDSDPIQALFSDNPLTLNSFSQPAVARTTGVFGQALVVAKRTTLLSTNSTLSGRVFNVDGTISGPNFTVFSASGVSVNAPDVDGYDRQWVCAFEDLLSSGVQNIRAVPVSYNFSTASASVGTPVTVASGSLLLLPSAPGVGFSQGKTWIGWRSDALLGGSDALLIKGFDSATCTACEGSFTLDLSDGSGDDWIAIATPTSGGAYYDDSGLAVWSALSPSNSTHDISAQLLENNAQGGSYQNLGGGCGNAGTLGFNGAPSIGSSWWYTFLTNLPPTTLAAFYNITTADPNLAVPCGACLWLPFEVSGASLVQFDPQLGGTASAVAVIPCKPSLVGAQVTVQWTTFNPATSPCPVYPNLSITDRWRVTIGQ